MSTVNTTKAPKAAANVNANVNANAPAKCKKSPEAPAQLSEAEIVDIIHAYAPASMSALRKLEAEISGKYGKSNWISIRARYQSDIRGRIDSAQAGAVAAAYDFANALADNYKRISVNADFVALASYINVSPADLAANWATGADFVAANFPHVINGKAARRISYVRPDKAGNPAYIVDAYELAEYTAANVPGLISACIRNIGTAARGYIKAISEKMPHVKQSEHVAGDIVAVYDIATDSATGRISKGTEAPEAVAANVARAGVKGLVTVAEYNRDYALTAADILAAVKAKAAKPEAEK